MTKSELKDYIVNIQSKYNKKQCKIVQTVINPVVKKELELLFPQFQNIHERLYWLMNDIKEYPKCPVCGKQITRFDMSLKRYCIYCSKRCGHLSKVTQEKFKRTMLKKYNTDHPSHSLIFLSKIKTTCLEKYGTEYPIKLSVFKEKCKRVWLEKYGTECSLQSPVIQEKIRLKNLELYGVEHSSKRKDVREKYKRTMLSKYNCYYPSQNKEIRKRMYSKYYFNDIIFDSCCELFYYFYLKRNNIKFEYQPDIYFEYGNSDIGIHRYYPDFRLNDGSFIEIKGDHFFDKNNSFHCPYFSNSVKDKLYYECILKNSTIIREHDFKNLGITFWNQQEVKKFCNFLRENKLSNFNLDITKIGKRNIEEFKRIAFQMQERTT